MTKKATFEMIDDNKTGIECAESGTYCCHLNSYMERQVSDGEIFPKCDKGIAHNTTW